MPSFVRPLNLKKPVVNRKLIAWGFILTGLVSLGSWAWGRWQIPANHSDAANADKGEGGGFWGPVKITYTVAPKSPPPMSSETISALQKLLDSTSGKYGIYVYRLSDKLGYGISADKVLPAASIMKVPIMVATYRQIEAGKIQLADVEPLLEAIGKRSDNEAPVTLTKMIGRPYIQQTLKDLGMHQSDFDQNTTTAYDLAQLWKTLYAGNLITSEHWRQMQQFLTDSIFEERIPAGVPDEIQVVHKVGTDINIWADSGIVMGAKPLVISILNDQVDLAAAKEVVPQLVRVIWSAESANQ
ncbi:MAG: serine hydrolase [bacterium]|nr:serine hydrolase [bacterium]